MTNEKTSRSQVVRKRENGRMMPCRSECVSSSRSQASSLIFFGFSIKGVRGVPPVVSIALKRSRHAARSMAWPDRYGVFELISASVDASKARASASAIA